MTEVTITNTTDSKKFIFRGAKQFRDEKSQTPDVMTMPMSDENDSMIDRFEGQDRRVSFSFTIFDNNVDVSDGTQAGGVKTISEQVDYLMNIFYGPNKDYTLVQDTIYPSGVTGVVERIDLTMVAGDTEEVLGNLTFRVGTVLI